MRMKRLLFAILCLLLLSPVLSRAETITHNFHTMSGTPALSYESNNTVGITDLVRYTCSGGAKAKFNSNTGKICICLPDRYDQVETSPSIADLESLEIMYFPIESRRTIKVYASIDNDVWTEATVEQSVPGATTFQLPATGDYYLKFKNEATSNDFYIRQINYIIKPSCACLKVVSE